MKVVYWRHWNNSHGYPRDNFLNVWLSSTGTSCYITGWGRTIQGGSMSAVLREAKVPLVSSQDCKKNYGSASITNNMLCAGILGAGVDACQGDSGGNGFRINNRKRFIRSEATNGSLSWNPPESFGSMWYSCSKVFIQTQNSYLFRIWSSWVYTAMRAIGYFWVPFNLYFKVSEAFIMNISLHSHWNSNQLPKQKFCT